MPDTRLPSSMVASGTSSNSPGDATRHRIMRKGSRYNILGPQGRLFAKYQSAKVAGPRWEELTCAPWPYASSAYARGQRLWELGLIPREQVGQRNIVVASPRPAPESKPSPKQGRASKPKPIIILTPQTRLALPAPRLDLADHERKMRALRQNPALLFMPEIRQALRHEVEYHRPQARLASHLLKLLARYERRQRQRLRAARVDSAAITAKHVAWQLGRRQVAVQT